MALVKAGLVKRTQGLADRRSVRLALSAAGRARVAAIDKMCNRYYTEMFEQLGEKDQRCIIRAVSLLANSMRSRRRAPDSRRVCGATPPKLSDQSSRRPRPRKGDKEDLK